jgi:putative N6-adenine-specific DNA methylase
MATPRKPTPAGQPDEHHYFCPCPRGLEQVLHDELRSLGAADVTAVDGGVAARGAWDLCYRINLYSRIASRVLWRIAQASYRNEADVYNAVKRLDWRKWLSADSTIRVNVAATGSPLRSLEFITLRIKDAVCDRFRADTGKRPSVDTADPDVRIHAYFDAATVTLYLDTSGEPLFKRGLRTAGGAAPLRENLAAGILRLAGWAPGVPLLDPMCGGGTFLIEAAEMALRRAPGSRRRFAFEKLVLHQPKRWEELGDEARAQELPPQRLVIQGSDLYGEALKIARQNLVHAGLQEAVSLKQVNVLELTPPPGGGVLVTNPPYGVRMGEQDELAQLYPKLGDALKARFAGWLACIFTADMRLPKLIGLKPARRIPLYNGALECRLYVFEMVAGSARGRAVKGEGVKGVG